METPASERGSDDADRTLSTLARATEIVEVLMGSGGATVAELAEELDTSKSTVYNYVSTLQADNWLVKQGSEYHLSLRFFRVGAFVRTSGTLFGPARPKIEGLAEETGETVHLSTEQHDRQIHLYKAHGPESVGSEYHQQKLHTSAHLHDTATGKAILAALPRERVETIVETHGLPATTDRTITDRGELFETLEAIRERGYACNDEEEIRGIRAVGAPLRNQAGDVLGSISVSGPTSRLRGDRFHEELPELVVRTANVIEVNIDMGTRLSEGET